MARISGMILGLGFLIVLSSLVSPVSAWDDDDDDHYRRRHWHGPHVIEQPVIIRPRHAVRPPLGIRGYPGQVQAPLAPPPSQQGPIIPPPLPPAALPRDETGHPHPSSEVLPSPAPPIGALPLDRPGQFVNSAVPLYPFVRVKNPDEAPRWAVPKILAVKSPDPFRFPGSVYVKVYVPPGPCRGVKMKHGGAYIKLDYGKYEVEVLSHRGVVWVEYDD